MFKRANPLEVENAHILGEFLADLADERQVTARTIEAYKYCVAVYLRHLEKSGLSLGSVSAEGLRSFIDLRKRSGVAASTLFQGIIALRHFYKFLLRKRIVHSDPTGGLVLPKLENKLPQPLSHEEMEKLLAAPKGPRFKNVRGKAILELLYATGLRITELATLKTSQVHLL